MKYILTTLLSLFMVCASFAQTEFTKSVVLEKNNASTTELLGLVKNAISSSLNISKEKNESDGTILYSGKGTVPFKTNTVYSSIVGEIEYEIKVIITTGKIEFVICNCIHKPGHEAAFDNNMGVLVDPLPKDLSVIGVKGANRKACYKYFYTNGKKVCEEKFNELSDKLKYVISD